MKKIILTITLAVVATVSIAQTKFKINKAIAEQTLSNGSKDKTTAFPDDMYVTFVGQYATVTDEANSIYKQASEIVDKNTPEYEASVWNATDESSSRVVCIILMYKATGELWFSVAYKNVTLMYRLEKVDY